jgi:hypothetical protein
MAGCWLDPATAARGWIYEKYYLSWIGGPTSTQAALAPSDETSESPQSKPAPPKVTKRSGSQISATRTVDGHGVPDRKMANRRTPAQNGILCVRTFRRILRLSRRVEQSASLNHGNIGSTLILGHPPVVEHRKPTGIRRGKIILGHAKDAIEERLPLIGWRRRVGVRRRVPIVESGSSAGLGCSEARRWVCSAKT